MRSTAILAALLLAGCAATSFPPEAERARCAAEGGCAVVSRAQVEEVVTEALLLGAQMGRQSCGRSL